MMLVDQVDHQEYLGPLPSSVKQLVQNCMEQPHDNIVCSDLGKTCKAVCIKSVNHMSLSTESC